MVSASPQIRELDRQRESDVILEVFPPMVELIGSVSEDLASLPRGPFFLGSLRDGRLRVLEPFEVAPMLEGSKHVLEATELNEFGFGDTFSEALADLQAAIAELYFTLEEDQELLGPDLLSVWDVLSRKVRKADAINSP